MSPVDLIPIAIAALGGTCGIAAIILNRTAARHRARADRLNQKINDNRDAMARNRERIAYNQGRIDAYESMGRVVRTATDGRTADARRMLEDIDAGIQVENAEIERESA